MAVGTIPAWDELGLIPPMDVERPASPEHSPYHVSLLDVVMRFSTSVERRRIIEGFLRYRAELHRMGMTDGFQWLDGSFMEEVEIIERRGPRDMDVVTFFHGSGSLVIGEEDAKLFDQAVAKNRFYVDAYFVDLEQLPPRELTFWSAYWYSMWSHRRTRAWKGYLQIELTPSDDATAIAWLSQAENMGSNHESTGTFAFVG